MYVLYNWKDEKGEKISRQKNGDLFDFMVSGKAGEKREKVRQREQDSSASPMIGCSCVNGLPILVRYWERNMLPPTSAKQCLRPRTASDWSTSSAHGRFDVRTQGSPCHCIWKLSFSTTSTQVALLLAFQVLPCVNLRGLVPHQASLLKRASFEELSDQTAA